MAATGKVCGYLEGPLFPGANSATPSLRIGGSTPAENYPVWDFDAGATLEYLDYKVFLNDYDDTNGLDLVIGYWAKATGTGTVIWEAAFRPMRDDNDSDDVDASHTYTFRSVTDTAPTGTPNGSGQMGYAVIPFTHAQLQGLVEGSFGGMRIRRNQGTLAGDAQLYALALKQG